ncbi:MAG: hypothetical protein ABI150_04425 [Nitrobacter sp.]
MSTSDDLRKHQLECLRLAAECTNLADEADTLELRAHFLRMAEIWSDPASKNPGPPWMDLDFQQ